jgi:hypothetical protein
MTNPTVTLEPATRAVNSGLLGSALRRLCVSAGSTALGPPVPWLSQPENELQTSDCLTDRLLEAVFEISEFDPLPHLDYGQEGFEFGLPAESSQIPASTKGAAAGPGTSWHTAAAPARSTLNSPVGLRGSDRRLLPRRESECVVSVCRCQIEERLTAQRIAWMLHATKLKGQLVDVSMSGVAFHLMEPLTAGSRILLRISNRTLDKKVDASATILRSRAASEGGWDVVCRFNKNLTFDQIRTVGRSLFSATIV